MASNNGVQVIVRLRPLNPKEQAEGKPPLTPIAWAVLHLLLTWHPARRYFASCDVQHAKQGGDAHPRHRQGTSPLHIQV
jgi:hypothetical protein